MAARPANRRGIAKASAAGERWGLMRTAAAAIAECFFVAAFVLAGALVALAAAVTPFELD